MRRVPVLAPVIALATVAGLAACDPGGPGPIVGGPCSYETSIIEATVTGHDEYGTIFDGPEGEFRVSEEYLGMRPEVGETLTLKRDRITEGTCTPEMYSLATEAGE